eukprot:TRINITY_DN3049_c0_g1_i6.p1 TRINITY_DN3049_c0_g1~~TRINITY_DN3049_c0_g1_i6.p1  ORF type:complete len:501 (-),score=71.13 TRINITY_DN3049_c0_g1_i6:66-1568(-)
MVVSRSLGLLVQVGVVVAIRVTHTVPNVHDKVVLIKHPDVKTSFNQSSWEKEELHKICKFATANLKQIGDSFFCVCDKGDRPHLFQRDSYNYKLVAEANASSSKPLAFDPVDNGLVLDEHRLQCADNCGLRYLKSSAPPIQWQIDASKEWPVVFVAVYKLSGPIVHSNPVFCPNLKVLEQINNGYQDCYRPGAKTENCNGGRTEPHEKSVVKGADLPNFLQDNRCIELIWDGNEWGKIWTPEANAQGCWFQGDKPLSVLSSTNEDGSPYVENRQGTGYGRLYWMTSENKVNPFDKGVGDSIQEVMSSCFHPTLDYRLDFNPGTYNLLKQNCNKFTSEVLRYLELPKFHKAEKKGKFSKIKLSATPEESKLRRFFSPVVSKVMGWFEATDKIELSEHCQAQFWNKKANCRRICSRAHWSVTAPIASTQHPTNKPEEAQWHGLRPTVTSLIQVSRLSNLQDRRCLVCTFVDPMPVFIIRCTQQSLLELPARRQFVCGTRHHA